MSGTEHLRRVRLAACAAPALFAAALVALPAAALAEDNGRAFFSASGSAGTTPKSSFYTSATTSFGAAVSAVAGGANETFFVVKGSPTVLGEYLGGYVTTAGQLYVLRYDGNVWSNEFNVTVGGDGLNGRRFDIAYEKTTGRAVLVYSSNLSTSGQQLAYRIRDTAVGSWGSVQLFGSALLTGTANSVKLALRPGTSEIAVAVVDTNSRLTALIWNESTWGSEPPAALTTSVNYTTSPGDLDAYGLGYAHSAGSSGSPQVDDLLVAWVDRAGSVYAERYERASGRWLASATALNNTASGCDPTSTPLPCGAGSQLVVVADPSFGSVGVVWSRPGSNVMLGAAQWYYQSRTTGWNSSTQQWTWWSSTDCWWTWSWSSPPTVQCAPPLSLAPGAPGRPFTGFWATDGYPAASELVVVFQESPGVSGRISFAPGASWFNVQTANISWTGSASKKWIEAEADPSVSYGGQALVLFSDSNNALWAKRVQFGQLMFGGFWYAWTNADNGSPPATSLATASAPSFAFDYQPPFIVLGDNSGTEAPAGTTTCAASPSSTAVYDVDHFTLATTSGSDTVTKVTVNVTAGANAIGTLYVTSDSGTGYTTYGSLANPVLGNNLITLTQSIPVNTTTTQYRIQVKQAPYSALPTGADYTITANVASVSGVAATATGTDATSGSVVVDRTPPLNPTWAAPPFNTVLSAPNMQVNFAWTNPPAPWVSTVILRGTSGAWDTATTSLTDGNTYSLGVLPDNDKVVYAGTGTSGTDPTVVGRYYYRAFAADSCNNYSTGLTSPTPAAPNPTTVVGLTATVNSCLDVTLVAQYAGDGNNNDTVSFTRSGTSSTCRPITRDPKTATWTCIDKVPSATATYNYAASFGDVDGVSGPNPVTAPPVDETKCPGGTVSLSPYLASSPSANAQPGQTNVLAGRFSLTASYILYLNKILLGNTGTAKPTDLESLNVYADTGSLAGSWDPGDTLVATAGWSSADNAWVTSGITLPTGTTDYIVTLSAAYGATSGRTFALSFSSSSLRVDSSSSIIGSQTITGGTITVSGTPLGKQPGDAAGRSQSRKPMVLILNPANGTVLSLDKNTPSKGVRVQVQVYDPSRTTITSVTLSHDGGQNGTQTFPDTLTRNVGYDSIVNPGGPPYYAGVFQADLTSIGPGSWTLQAQATTSGGGTTWSAPVMVTVNPSGTGDGNLLVRNDSSQLCADCHAVQTHSSQATANPQTGVSKYGAWGVSCRDCHAPHKSRNAQLVREVIVPPAYSTYQPARTVRFWDRGTGDSGAANTVSFVTSSVTLTGAGTFGPCQACHTRTGSNGGTPRWRSSGNSDQHYVGSTTKPCTTCHLHSAGFSGNESLGGVNCTRCHGAFQEMQAGSHLTRHTLGSTLGTNDSYQDTSAAWAGTLASAVAVADRSCVNMCHGDHVHNDPSAWPAATHSRNFYRSPATQASRALTRDTNSASPTYGYATTASTGAGLVWRDFVPGNYDRGCLGCHTNPVDANRPAINGPAYNASAHDVTVAPSGTTWEYVMHDDSRGGTPNYDSRFTRNCTKCHASPAEGVTPSWTASVQGVHYSDNPSLLSGPVVRAQVCFNCHGNGSYGKNLSNKDVATPANNYYYHPASHDYTHSTVSEKVATFNSGAYSLSNRHASCLDCHDPHVAGGTKVNRAMTADANRNRIPAGSPLLGATGIQYGPVAGKSYPAFPAVGAWPASTAANYGGALVAQPTYEYEICFKCHTAFAYGGTAASDNGFAGPVNTYAGGTSGQAETDLGMEFSPTMRSGHPVVAPLNSYTGSSAPRALDASRLLPPWNTNIGNQTMLCTDCHGADSAAPAVQGPHGSAYAFMLAGPNQLWPYQDPRTQKPWTLISAGNFPGLFCMNCHPQMNTNILTPTGTNWAHAWAAWGHYYDIPNGPVTACISCHVAIPHGSKLGRLIVTQDSPRRYRATGVDASGQLKDFQVFKAFTKGNMPFAGQTWTTSCGVDHSNYGPAQGLGPVGGDGW